MRAVGIKALKNRLSEYVRVAASGETVLVTDRDQIVALFGADSPRLEMLERRGATVVGDVHPEVAHVAGALTPVPGGVGPLTIAMLLSNTLRAAEMRRGT